MEIWQIVLVTILVYQFIGFIVLLISEMFGSGLPEAVEVILQTGIWGGFFILIGSIVRKSRKIKRQIGGVCIVQRYKDPDKSYNDYVEELIKYKDLPYFEISRIYQVVNKYPKKSDIMAGYMTTNINGEQVERGYDLQFVSDKTLEMVKNEKSCLNCKFDGNSCTDDVPLCKIMGETPDFSHYERRECKK